MQKLIIKSKKNLKGKISISGSKNATLPILAASILSNKSVTLKNVPFVQDVYTMINLLKHIGMNIKIFKSRNILKITNNKSLQTVAPYRLLKTMRAGVLVLGPLLARYKKAKVSLPGGCAIGTRPVNLHLFALKKLGAKIKIKNGYIYASAKKGLKGNIINFPSISVGATENAILAAVNAKGQTTLINCAIEPEIQDMIIFLNKIGCKIKISEKRKILITGIIDFVPTTHKIIFDRIELGTYLIAAALVGEKIILTKINPHIIKTEIKILKNMGVKLIIDKNKITVLKSENIKNITLKTEPYPGFPTDLQAQIMVLMTKARGKSIIKENIFENRFMHVPELRRMGAKIETKNNIATVSGQCLLSGAEVMATDLRASVSLVLAGLVADNRTIINRVYHLDRGYENLDKKLLNCKADIRRI
ncbi:MAG: UDP-N-acetylglucosamine 1-carboxyvinyltransferase [Pelagibacterales bacterium]|jgi:UDP-N-acetylglucosamine 1-carboxyvinyltransferase|nr:UDP-N-acetylglucosamine 1-carboxyvinyltransferase [Pelagibacterales bacterium]